MSVKDIAKEFVNEHPYLTAAIVGGTIGGIVGTIYAAGQINMFNTIKKHPGGSASLGLAGWAMKDPDVGKVLDNMNYVSILGDYGSKLGVVMLYNDQHVDQIIDIIRQRGVTNPDVQRIAQAMATSMVS